MAVTAVNTVVADGVQPSETTPVTLYNVASNTGGLRLTACTVYNPTATTCNYSIYIMAEGGTPVAQYQIIDTQPLAAHETVALPELINQLIPKGGAIAFQSDTASTAAIRASGILF